MMLVKLYSENEIMGRIYMQICNLFPDPILREHKDIFFEHAFSVMHKLSATKYHLDNYIRIEKQQYEHSRRFFKKQMNETREAFELIFELEAFLFQIKSSLDMLAKLMIPIVGKNVVQTQTYGDKGEKLIKGLTQYKQKKEVNVVAIDHLINLIKSDKDSWLEKVVGFRDELNHYKALRDYRFEPIQMPKGQIGVRKPAFKNMNTVEFMKLTFSNNIEFHQDFMALALAIKAPPIFQLIPQDATSAIKDYNHEAARYIKWAWGLRPEAMVK